jgi:hypothetical protein
MLKRKRREKHKIMTLICIPEEIKSEFSVSEDGKAYASRRATARLVGIKSHATSDTPVA